MKKNALLALLALLAVASTPLFAAEEKIEGEAVCAKCELKEVKDCQMSIKVVKDGKTENYLAENNAVAKAFHKTICEDTEKVVAEGTVTEKDGKKIITLTSVKKAE